MVVCIMLSNSRYKPQAGKEKIKKIKKKGDIMTRPYVPGNKYRRPETLQDLHRPPGSPMAREVESQKAQLLSKHQHGTSKAVKWKMSGKTGLYDDRG